MAADTGHVWPRSRGGSDEYTNLILACYGCNTSRQSRPADQFADAPFWRIKLARR